MHSSSEPIRLGLTDNCHYVSANKLQDGSNTSTGDTVDPEYEVAEHPATTIQGDTPDLYRNSNIVFQPTTL